MQIDSLEFHKPTVQANKNTLSHFRIQESINQVDESSTYPNTWTQQQKLKGQLWDSATDFLAGSRSLGVAVGVVNAYVQPWWQVPKL